jgi:hypothetical protein
VDTVDNKMNTISLQTGLWEAIGDGVRGRCQNGVSDAKLTEPVDRMCITSRPVDNLIDCAGANDGTGLNSQGVMRWT